MKATRRTKIRLEKHELKLVRGGQTATLFCQNCQTETRHLTVAQTAQVLEMSEMAVFRLAESGQIHSIETADGRLLICTNSGLKIEKKFKF
jgi:protein-arginine kinase activator protein McsA